MFKSFKSGVRVASSEAAHGTAVHLLGFGIFAVSNALVNKFNTPPTVLAAVVVTTNSNPTTYSRPPSPIQLF